MHGHGDTHTHTHTCTHTHTHTHIVTHARTYTRTHALTHTYARIHTHTHTHLQSLSLSKPMPPAPESSLAVKTKENPFRCPFKRSNRETNPSRTAGFSTGDADTRTLKRNRETLIPGELDLVPGMQTPVPLKQNGGTLIPHTEHRFPAPSSKLRASLSGTFLQTLPDLVTPLKGHSLSPRSCPPTRSAPSERFGY